MTPEQFIIAWGGSRADNPLARIRQSLQNVSGYAELILESFDDGFRPPAAAPLDSIRRECRQLPRDIVDLLAVSNSFYEANANLAEGLSRKIGSMLSRIQKLVASCRRETFLPDLKMMQRGATELSRQIDDFATRAGSP